MQKKLHVKVGDKVKVISGESKGQEGSIIGIDRDKLLVEKGHYYGLGQLI